MAIQIDELKLPITSYEARDYLQKCTDEFGVFFDLERCFELCGILFRQNVGHVKTMRQLADTVSLDVSSKEEVVTALRKMGVNGSEFFQTGKLALNDAVYSSILNNKNYDDRIKKFTSTYASYASNNKNIGYFRGLGDLPQSVVLAKNGHRMTIGHPTWKVLSTSRLAASKPGVQGVPRNAPEIITEPKGYTLIRADSGQIEPRINFSYFMRDELLINLIMHYADAYFGIWRFCVMGEEEERACREDFERNFKHVEVDQKVKDERQDIKTLSLAGSYGSANLDKINPVLAAAYDKKIVHHPARIAWENRVKEEVSRGVSTFYGAFGTPVTPDSTERYTKGDSGWNNHLVRCGINNPIQTTASELMLCSLNKARDVLSHAKDSHICFYKHDEACFYVSDADIADGVLDELSDITAYNVKGWIPIEAEPEIGIKKGPLPMYL